LLRKPKGEESTPFPLGKKGCAYSLLISKKKPVPSGKKGRRARRSLWEKRVVLCTPFPLGKKGRRGKK
jgi:hypothetical protein